MCAINTCLSHTPHTDIGVPGSFIDAVSLLQGTDTPSFYTPGSSDYQSFVAGTTSSLLGVAALVNGNGYTVQLQVQVFLNSTGVAGAMLGSLAGTSTSIGPAIVTALPSGAAINLQAGLAYQLVFRVTSTHAMGVAQLGLDLSGHYAPGRFHETAAPAVSTTDAIFATLMGL